MKVFAGNVKEFCFFLFFCFCYFILEVKDKVSSKEITGKLYILKRFCDCPVERGKRNCRRFS